MALRQILFLTNTFIMRLILIFIMLFLANSIFSQSTISFNGGEMIFTNLKPLASAITEKRSYPSAQVSVVINATENRIAFNDIKGFNIDQYPLTSFSYSGSTGVAAITPFLTAKGAADISSGGGGGSSIIYTGNILNTDVRVFEFSDVNSFSTANMYSYQLLNIGTADIQITFNSGDTLYIKPDEGFKYEAFQNPITKELILPHSFDYDSSLSTLRIIATYYQ